MRSHENIGIMLHESGQPAEALKSHESARKVRQKLADDNPSVTWNHQELASSHFNIGNLLRTTGKSAEALKSYESALLIWRKLARDHPESPFFQAGLGGTLNKLAMIELDAKRFEQARHLLRQAIESQRKALAVNSANPGFRRPMGAQLNNLIKACRGLNDAKGAAEAEQELAKFRASDPAMVAMDARLAGILKGDQTPRDNSERLQLAQRATRRHFTRPQPGSGPRRWRPSRALLSIARPSIATTLPAPPRWRARVTARTTLLPMTPPKPSSAATLANGSSPNWRSGPRPSIPARQT